FSSRRRHTRCLSDWSSDVCSPDLLALAGKLAAWDEVVVTLEDGAVAAPNSDLGAGLWARSAEIHELRRRDLPRAISAWRKVEDRSEERRVGKEGRGRRWRWGEKRK